MSFQWEEHHLSLKAGPGGGPAILGALSDLVSLPGTLIESIKVLGGELLSENIEQVLEMIPLLQSVPLKLFKVQVGAFRRIGGIPDKEGKTRVIAMLDFWSQSALRPLHFFLFDILRRIPQDVTFSQGSFVDHVRRWGRGVTLYSVDLSSATDRFPIDLIASVLKGVLPSSLVEA